MSPPVPAPPDRRTHNLSTLVLWVSLASLLLVVLPAVWFARRSFQQAHVSHQLVLLKATQAELAAHIDRCLDAEQASVERVARWLSTLEQAPAGQAAARFQALFDRQRKAVAGGAGADGSRTATLVLPRGGAPDAQGKALLVLAEQTLDEFARIGGLDGDELWVQLAGGGGVVLGQEVPGWLRAALPDPFLPSHAEERAHWSVVDAEGQADRRWLSIWQPWTANGRVVGRVGRELLLSGLTERFGALARLDGVSVRLLPGGGGSLSTGEQPAPGAAGAADESRWLSALEQLERAADHSLSVEDGQATLLLNRLRYGGWVLATEIPHAALLASMEAHNGLFWAIFAALLTLLTLLTLLPVLVVSRVLRRSVRALVRASREVEAGGGEACFLVGGPREFRTIAGAIERMLAHLAESRERIRVVLETVADGVITVDDQARIESLNASALRMFGARAEQLFGRPVSDLGPAFRSLEALIEGVEDTGSWALDELPEARHQDGHTFPVEIRTRLTICSERHLVTLTVRDLTRRQEARREHEALESELRQAQKMEAVGQLAGGVAHDFNNLLTGIMGYAEGLVAVLPEGGGEARDAGQIVRTAERAAALTRQLLLFSRRQELRPEDVDLNQLLTGLTPLLQRLLGEGLELCVDPGVGLGAVRVDPSRMEQVVMNLVVNAADAMPGGGTIRVSTAECTLAADDPRKPALLDPGRYVCLAVADTGEGMPPEVLASIFEPFFTTKQPGRGTGLGLSTVFGVVRESGGDVRVDSRPGEGTRFEVLLPWRGAVEATADAVRQDSPAAGSETVLVVEDEPTVRRLVQRLLEDQGYSVLVAEDGESGLKLIAAHEGPIDLLLSDVVMPGMSGPELAERVLRQRADLAVLFMSGYPADALTRHGGGGFAAEDVLAKPFGLAEMSRRVRACLDRALARR